LSFREMYGFGEVGAVTKVLMLLVGKDICNGALELELFLGLSNWDFTLPLYRFRLKHLVQ